MLTPKVTEIVRSERTPLHPLEQRRVTAALRHVKMGTPSGMTIERWWWEREERSEPGAAA